jgi:hypothetical protein
LEKTCATELVCADGSGRVYAVPLHERVGRRAGEVDAADIVENVNAQILG